MGTNMAVAGLNRSSVESAMKPSTGVGRKSSSLVKYVTG
jgi:hypothetical protein